MAVVFTIVRRNISGAQRRVLVDVVGPASYTTGGEALTVAQFSQLFPEIASNATTADWTKCIQFDSETNPVATPAFLSTVLDRTNAKLIYTTAGAQTTSTQNLSAQTVRAEFVYSASSG